MVNATTAGDATISLESPRFGAVTCAETDVLVFPWGLPGFDHLRSFVVLSLESQAHLLWLQSIEEPEIALPVADPWMFFADYDPKLPGFARLSLELENPEDFTLLAVVVVPEEGPMFMNLYAPILLNLKKRLGRQVALESGNYSVATQIPQSDDAAAEQAEPVSE